MSFQKFEIDSYCVGGRHRTATTKIYVGITSKGNKVLIGFCSKCNRKKTMTVSDNTIQAEGVGDFFKTSGKKGLSVSKKMAKNVLKNPERALENGANVAPNPKAALSSLPEVINVYLTGKRLYLPRFI